MKTSITVSQHIKARREKVYHAWTTKWIGPEGLTVKKFSADVRPGGKWSLQMAAEGENFATEGTYLEVIPNEKLVFTWDEEGPSNPITRVTVTFKDKDGGTLVTVLHDRFMDEEQAEAHTEGWASMLQNLEKLLLL
jgi:uncharacterized protein YndB with AHSA1/START domain